MHSNHLLFRKKSTTQSTNDGFLAKIVSLARNYKWRLRQICFSFAYLPLLSACSGEGTMKLRKNSQATEGCSCSVVINGQNVTKNCSETLCGTDHDTYLCTEYGWSNQGPFCGECSCSVTVNNQPVTVACNDTFCGTDHNLSLIHI